MGSAGELVAHDADVPEASPRGTLPNVTRVEPCPALGEVGGSAGVASFFFGGKAAGGGGGSRGGSETDGGMAGGGGDDAPAFPAYLAYPPSGVARAAPVPRLGVGVGIGSVREVRGATPAAGARGGAPGDDPRAAWATGGPGAGVGVGAGVGAGVGGGVPSLVSEKWRWDDVAAAEARAEAVLPPLPRGSLFAEAPVGRGEYPHLGRVGSDAGVGAGVGVGALGASTGPVAAAAEVPEILSEAAALERRGLYTRAVMAYDAVLAGLDAWGSAGRAARATSASAAEAGGAAGVGAARGEARGLGLELGLGLGLGLGREMARQVRGGGTQEGGWAGPEDRLRVEVLVQRGHCLVAGAEAEAEGAAPLRRGSFDEAGDYSAGNGAAARGLALDSFRRALDVDAAHAGALNGLGACLRARGQLQEAVHAHARALRVLEGEVAREAQAAVERRRRREARRLGVERGPRDGDRPGALWSDGRLGGIGGRPRGQAAVEPPAPALPGPATAGPSRASSPVPAEGMAAAVARALEHPAAETVEAVEDAVLPALEADRARTRGLLADVLAELGEQLAAADLREACARYHEALAVDPDHVRALYLLGMACASEARAGVLSGGRRWEEASEFFAEAIARDPGFADAHLQLGLVRADRGDAEAACLCYAAALRARPGMPQALEAMASSLTSMATRLLREPAEAPAAVALLRRALTHWAAHAPAWRRLGDALAAVGSLDESLIAYNRCVALDPSCLPALVALAAQYRGGLQRPFQQAMGEDGFSYRSVAYGRPRGDADGALATAGAGANTSRFLSGELYCAPDLPRAVACLEQALRHAPGDAGVLLSLGENLALLGRHREAVDAVAQCLRADPGLAQAHALLGALRRDEGDLLGALDCFEACLALSPEGRDAAQHRLVCLALLPAPLPSGDGEGSEPLLNPAASALFFQTDPERLEYLAAEYCRWGSVLAAPDAEAYRDWSHLEPLELGDARPPEEDEGLGRDEGEATAEVARSVGKEEEEGEGEGEKEGEEQTVEAAKLAEARQRREDYELARKLYPDIPARQGVEKVKEARLKAKEEDAAVEGALENVVADASSSDVEETIGGGDGGGEDEGKREGGGDSEGGTEAKASPEDEDSVLQGTLALGEEAETSDPATASAPKRFRRLRVGYIGSNFCREGSTAPGTSCFVESVLFHHDRKAFDVFVYSNAAAPDERTAFLRVAAEYAQPGGPSSGCWRDIFGMDARGVAELIRGDGIDLLVDLEGHTSGNRLDAWSLRPAPVQVVWLPGHPGVTTGVPNFDHVTGASAVDGEDLPIGDIPTVAGAVPWLCRLTDAVADPDEASIEDFTEERVRLPSAADDKGGGCNGEDDVVGEKSREANGEGKAEGEEMGDTNGEGSAESAGSVEDAVEGAKAASPPGSESPRVKVGTGCYLCYAPDRIALGTPVSSLPALQAYPADLRSELRAHAPPLRADRGAIGFQGFPRASLLDALASQVMSLHPHSDRSVPSGSTAAGSARSLPASSRAPSTRAPSEVTSDVDDNEEQAHAVPTVPKVPAARPWLTSPTPAEPLAALSQPRLLARPFTFGCFCAPSRLNDVVLRVWARVLKAVPGARLLLAGLPFHGEAARRAMERRFEALGVGADRLSLVPNAATREEQIQFHASVDVALDAFPVSDTALACEALVMGVPTVTLCGAGQTVASRSVASVMAAADPGGDLHRRCVAHSPEGYVQRCADFASDLPALASLRGSLRAQVLESPLCDGPAFTRGLERTLWGLFARWEAALGVTSKARGNPPPALPAPPRGWAHSGVQADAAAHERQHRLLLLGPHTPRTNGSAQSTPRSAVGASVPWSPGRGTPLPWTGFPMPPPSPESTFAEDARAAAERAHLAASHAEDAERSAARQRQLRPTPPPSPQSTFPEHARRAGLTAQHAATAYEAGHPDLDAD